MSNTIDLHIHSVLSDGTYTNDHIFRHIRNKQLSYISITDHDTVDAYTTLPDEYENCQIIKGIEISAQDPCLHKPIHILGYGLKSTHYVSQLCMLNLNRRKRISLWQVSRLREFGYPITHGEVYKKACASTSIYKQHIMDVMIDHKYCTSIYAPLYKQLFKNEGICRKDMDYVDVKQAIQAIHSDGGLAFLAHPYLSNVYADILYFKELGIDGIETWHSSHSAGQALYLHELAIKFDLYESGGSDAHGRYGNEPEMGESSCIVDQDGVLKWITKC